MSKQVLRVPGLATPHWILWIHGWFQGHVLKSGGLDPETERISSSYITGMCRLFRKACAVRMEALEKELQNDWRKADELLVEYKNLSEKLGCRLSEPMSGTDSARARAMEEQEKVRTGVRSRREEVVRELVTVTGRIESTEYLAWEQMEAAAEKLRSAFAAYGHGLILEPVYAYNLPELVYKEYFEEYRKSHMPTTHALDKIVSEVKEAI